MLAGIKSKNHDYTEEIIRCIDFIIGQIRKGIKIKDAIIQAEQSYGYSISLNAKRALYRNLIIKK